MPVREASDEDAFIKFVSGLSDMKSHIFALFTISMLLLASTAQAEDIFTTYPAHSCTDLIVNFSTVGFTDTFTMVTLDAKLRPLPGAIVWITYDRGVTFGDQYYTTPPVPTDAKGRHAFTVSNGGTVSRDTDCTIRIGGEAGFTNAQNSFTALAHSQEIWLTFKDVYPVDFTVTDQHSVPIPNASVTFVNITKKTDGNGMVRFYSNKLPYNYLVSYNDGRQSGVLTIQDDTKASIVLNRYPVIIDIVDDSNMHIPATVRIANKTYDVPNGVFSDPGLFGDEIPYTVVHKSIEISGTLRPDIKSHISVVYDLHAPIFGQITTAMNNGRIKMSIPITDSGEVSSGIDPTSLKVFYRIEREGTTQASWSPAIAYTTGRNTYSADFPEFQPNSIVQFRVEIKDYAGNKATVEGRFSTYASVGGENTSQNVTNPPITTPEGQGFPLLYTAIGVIIVIFVLYIAIRTISKAKDSGP